MNSPLVMGPYERLLWRWVGRLLFLPLVVWFIHTADWWNAVLFWYVWGVSIRVVGIITGEASNKATAWTVVIPFVEPLRLVVSIPTRARRCWPRLRRSQA